MSRARSDRRWTTTDSSELYGIDAWGKDFVSINDKGHLAVGPTKEDKIPVDLKELVDEVIERGIAPPLLIRFADVLRARLAELHGAFYRAIDEYDYPGEYRGVFPIKVNQNQRLIEDLVRFGEPYHYGLEAGSKPELLAVMAMLSDPDALVVCNGYKDEEYIETALLASQIGPQVVLVVEKPAELRLIAEVAERTGVRPRLGVRSRLATRGSGHWEASGGDHSKFGLGAREMLEAVEFLGERDLLDCLVLLHFHLGSQISSIRSVKDALREAGWLYVNLKKMGVPLSYLDVGGGLGVDYDGSQSNFTSSMNYTLQEYANDIVYNIQEVCKDADVDAPTLVTEAGRATVAHHAVLVFEVLDVGTVKVGEVPAEAPPDAGMPLQALVDLYRELTSRNLRESYHDAQHYRDECLQLFKLGHLSLEQRVLADDVFWSICRKVRDLADDVPRIAQEIKGVEQTLADIYYCNFSIFQSMPDSWAIDQLFPVLPIHRLEERPERLGVIADMTCDSDGKIDHFIDRREIRKTLELHALREEPYYVAAFLVGAYQEILGDLHNLFGDTNTVHVSIDEDGGYSIDHVVEGDTVREVLKYMGYHRDDLMARMRRSSEKALRAQRITREQARRLMRIYEAGLAGYTYLERD